MQRDPMGPPGPLELSALLSAAKSDDISPCTWKSGMTRYCPRRKPPFWAVKRRARPHESAARNRFTAGALRLLRRPGRARTVMPGNIQDCAGPETGVFGV